MTLFHAYDETTLVEVTVGELLDAFEAFDVTPWDPDTEVPLVYAQRAAVQLLELLGAPDPKIMVMPWEATPTR